MASEVLTNAVIKFNSFHSKFVIFLRKLIFWKLAFELLYGSIFQLLIFWYSDIQLPEYKMTNFKGQELLLLDLLMFFRCFSEKVHWGKLWQTQEEDQLRRNGFFNNYRNPFPTSSSNPMIENAESDTVCQYWFPERTLLKGTTYVHIWKITSRPSN